MNQVFCVTGVSGQDGSYAAELLIEIGIPVIGLTRNQNKMYKNLLNIIDSKDFKLIETDYSENELSEIIRVNKITHILNFCGQSYVSRSWEMIEETINSQSLIVSRFINIIRKSDQNIRLLNSSSSEIFAESKFFLHEGSNLSPCNPYGCSQLLSFSLIKSIRDNSGIWASSAILFPHESIRRSEGFLFKKILKQVDDILLAKASKITIGNEHVIRDWGLAIDYVYYMLLIISKERPIDICICTSEGNSVKNLVKSICNRYELNCDDLVRIDNSLSRQYEPKSIIGENKLLKDHLKIESPLKMNEAIKKIINNINKIKEDERKLDRVSDFLNKEKINLLKKSFSL